jgi:rod shape determining protein RodA
VPDLPFSQEHLEIVRAGMAAVANDPTGGAFKQSQLGLGDVKMAGKTGTAQVRQYAAGASRSNQGIAWRLKDHNLFIAFAPYDNPRYALSVIIEHGGQFGSSAAAPRAREVMRVALLKDPEILARIEKPMPLPEAPFALTLCLIAGAGAVMLFSIAGSSWQPWAAAHLIRFAMCLVMMVALAMIDLRVWFALAYPVYGLGLLLLVAVEAIGDVRLGAQRWLSLGPLSFQPSEVMKLGIVMALARFYHGASADSARLSWRLLIPVAMIGAPVLLVAHQPDLGTAMLIAMTGLAIIVLAGLDWRVIIAGVIGLVAVIPPFVMFVMHDYQRKRVLTFLDPESDPSGSGYHILQSKIALGSGGLLGKGYGLGSQSQLNFLPEKQTDFIFATLAEEFGFVGCMGVLALYAAVIFMALRTAYLSHSHFGRLAAAGLTATFALYVMINGAMVMGLAPVVGVPMPLLSYGGTVMVTVMVGFGLVQSVRVHRYAEISSGKGSLL